MFLPIPQTSRLSLFITSNTFHCSRLNQWSTNTHPAGKSCRPPPNSAERLFCLGLYVHLFVEEWTETSRPAVDPFTAPLQRWKEHFDQRPVHLLHLCPPPTAWWQTIIQVIQWTGIWGLCHPKYAENHTAWLNIIHYFQECFYIHSEFQEICQGSGCHILIFLCIFS